MRIASAAFIMLSSCVVMATPAASASAGGSIPDFSGIWAHITWPDFEPPLTGPGPVKNLSRVSNTAGFGNNGAGSIGSSPNGVSNVYQLVGDFTDSILKAEAAEIVKQHGEISLDGLRYPTPANQCWPGGVPFMFASNLGMQMLQQEDKVTILYERNHEVRHVRMNQPHPEVVTPSWYGDSVGHYEGDTLVIDTVGIKVGPFAMVDMYGTPHSPALHVVERHRLLDYEAAKDVEERGQQDLFRFNVSDAGLARNPEYKGKGLQLEFTVEDPRVFTMPWSASVSYRRPSGEWPEIVCAENPNGHVPGENAAVPTADRPDF
jgi:hypothetical protein